MRICLYQPDIAGNVGNIIRTAECLGFCYVDIILPMGFVFDNKSFRRSAMDYGSGVKVTTYKTFEDYCTLCQGRKLLLTTGGKTVYYNFQFKQSDIIVFGSESRGVSDAVKNIVDEQLIIPMSNNCRSLNLAISVGIVAGEMVRQLKSVI